LPRKPSERRSNLVFRGANSHIEGMATTAKKTTRARRVAPAEKAFVYRGIKIQPVTGRRSPLSKALRDEIRKLAEQKRGEHVPA